MKPVRNEIPLTFAPKPKPNPAQETPAYMEIYPDKKGNKA